MSTPVIVAVVVGAFVVGVLLGLLVARMRPRVGVVVPVPQPEVPAQAPTPAEVAIPVRPRPATHRAEYVITSAGEPEIEVEDVPRREFTPRPQFEQVARTVMIEAASLAHGVRNALSEENRAKISYEVKRELVRVRKDRRIEVREALREYRATHRAPSESESGDGA